MGDDVYVWIPNWDGPGGFQHYKERDPIWIKNYTRLLSHDDYLALSGHRRAILHGTWMAYATSARRLRGDTLTLSRRLSLKVATSDLKALTNAGFVELVASNVLAERLQAASNPLALTRARALAREEEEVDRAIPKAVSATTDEDDPSRYEPDPFTPNGQAPERTAPVLNFKEIA